jgi:endonuclease-3
MVGGEVCGKRMGPYSVKDRLRQILGILIERYGTRPWNWHTRQTPFQVLIGTVLSQRTRDEKTDAAARALFSRYPSAAELASARVEEIETLIRPVNYYRTKARRIREISTVLLENYCGKTPETISELIRLPGVGRKTACCVMVYGFGKPALPVDTHVHRISNRLGLIRTRSPGESERALMALVPEEYLMNYNELMVKHGQSICKPIGPRCHSCPVVRLCEFGSRQEPGRRRANPQ